MNTVFPRNRTECGEILLRSAYWRDGGIDITELFLSFLVREFISRLLGHDKRDLTLGVMILKTVL